MAWKDKRKAMQAYDITAEMYDERYGEEQGRKYRKALESVDVVGKVVLDAGCGSGLFFSQAAGQAKVVVGIDVSRKLLLKAKAQVSDFGNVFLVQADADHLPFQNDFFGAVFAFTMLQNMPKPTETSGELKRVAKIDAKIVVTGLKKFFPNKKFMDFLENSGMQVVAFVDDEPINCYIAVLAA
jgi:ubiquinone/menaquinone biosynthesis C-methylase UbiE